MAPLGREPDDISFTKARQARLDHAGPALERLGDALEIIASDQDCARMTVRQLLAYVRTAQCYAAGRPVALADIRDSSEASLGPSIVKTFDVFFASSAKHNPDGKGWVEQEIDDEDRRRRLLTLTKAGANIARALAKANTSEGEGA